MRSIKNQSSPIEPGYIIRHRDIELLRSFLRDQGKILPRRSTHLTVKQQKQLSKAVKRARMLKLLPYVIKDEE
jgi:small subunit ribosomal protein S18|uniref:ribosomal protein S18 n=1 Tax=Gonyostomum semen TaxID=375454 RepID=UPI002115347C|nr:ribosomal protein S18 [Gonyostomum semen]UTE94375.1 ribosomal protein S18 [Gonyostomum semen]